MMKNSKAKFITGFFLATFAIGTAVSAQPLPFQFIKKDTEYSNSYKKAQQFLKVKHSTIRNKPTTLKQRVLSQVSFDEDQLPVDSTNFTYSNLRGSDFDYYNLNFGFNADHEPGIIPIQSSGFWDNNSMSAYADTIKNYLSYNNGQFDFSVAHYRADNQIDSIITGIGDQTSLTAMEKIENTFESGKIKTTTRKSINDPNSYSVISYYYNASNSNLLADSTFYFTGGNSYFDWATSYKYDANDRIDSILTYASPNSQVLLVDFVVFSYYPNGDVLSTNHYELEPVSSNFQIAESDTFSYFSNFDAYESLKSYGYEDGQLEMTISFQGTLGASGFPDTIKAQVTDYGENETIDVILVYDYNSFNNPIKLTQYEHDTLADGIDFRYEEYNDSTTSIQSIAHTSFEIFPNPVKDQFTINNKNAFSGIYSISLIDLSGRTVFERKQSIGGGKNIISIPEVSKGIYILKLKNSKGDHFSQKMVKE